MKKTAFAALLLIACGSIQAHEREGMPPAQFRAIDSCLTDLMLAARTADSSTSQRIVRNVRSIRSILAPPGTRPTRPLGMDSARFLELFGKVQKAFPYRDQRSILKLAAVNNRFSMRQTQLLLQPISFSADKRDAVSILLRRTVDLENLDILYDEFWTPDQKMFLGAVVDSVMGGIEGE